MDYFLGEIRPFALPYAPAGWALCNGQMLPISNQYTVLFSLLGTSFGGNGTTQFQLPNLQGQVIVGTGALQGGQDYVIGETGGSAGVALTTDEIPNHTHTLSGAVGGAGTGTVITNAPAANASSLLSNLFGTMGGALTPGGMYSHTAVNAQMGVNSITPAGGGQPHENRPPFLVINYCININGGQYPRRN